MKRVGLALVGLGNVGRRFLRLLIERNNMLREKYGLVFSVNCVVDSSGVAISDDGFDLPSLLEHKMCGLKLRDLREFEEGLTLAATCAIGDVITQKSLAPAIKLAEWRGLRVCRTDEREPPVPELGHTHPNVVDKVFSATDLAPLPRGLESTGMCKPSRGERGVGELPDQPVRQGHSFLHNRIGPGVFESTVVCRRNALARAFVCTFVVLQPPHALVLFSRERR